jgi:hypothetical protein
MSDIPDILTLYPVSKIEALERTARVDASIAKQLSQSMAINATLRARIEALEAALKNINEAQGDWHDGYREGMRDAKKISEAFSPAADRIKALEAALRECVQYHVKTAADCRAISAVNQDNTLGADSLTAAIDHDIAAEDIGEIARAALDKDAKQ